MLFTHGKLPCAIATWTSQIHVLHIKRNSHKLVQYTVCCTGYLLSSAAESLNIIFINKTKISSTTKI